MTGLTELCLILLVGYLCLRWRKTTPPRVRPVREVHEIGDTDSRSELS